MPSYSIALTAFHQPNWISETIRILGCPTRRQFYSWINDENLPSKERKRVPRIANSPAFAASRLEKGTMLH